jgi:exodeoxyribonuclease VII large subunit
VRYNGILARQRYSALAAEQVLARAKDAIGRRGQRLDELERRMDDAVSRKLTQRRDAISELRSRVERQSPEVKLAVARRRLETAEQCVRRLSASAIADRSRALEHSAARLRALSPLAVLNRGYSLVYGPDGTLLRDVTQVTPGETVRARLGRGSLDAQVVRTEPEQE